MKIKFLIAAEEHLDDIYNQVAEKSERAAINIYNDFLDEIDRLKDFPQIASLEPVLSEESQIFRSLVVRHNYKVIYYQEDDIIYISAIWDCRQSPKKLKDKISRK